MESLNSIYARQGLLGRRSDKGTVHSYIEVYEELFAPYRTTSKRILEIGLFEGHSMRLWEEYFQGAEVHGVDLSDTPHCGLADLRPMLAEGTHKISFMDAANLIEVEHIFNDMKFDVVIEDANHYLEDQIAIWNNMRSRLVPDGLYIIEDVADVDRDGAKFLELDPSARIMDRRKIKDRFDDVLIVIGGGR